MPIQSHDPITEGRLGVLETEVAMLKERLRLLEERASQLLAQPPSTCSQSDYRASR